MGHTLTHCFIRFLYVITYYLEAEDQNSPSRRTMEDIHIIKDNFGGLQGQGTYINHLFYRSFLRF